MSSHGICCLHVPAVYQALVGMERWHPSGSPYFCLFFGLFLGSSHHCHRRRLQRSHNDRVSQRACGGCRHDSVQKTRLLGFFTLVLWGRFARGLREPRLLDLWSAVHDLGHQRRRELWLTAIWGWVGTGGSERETCSFARINSSWIVHSPTPLWTSFSKCLYSL